MLKITALLVLITLIMIGSVSFRSLCSRIVVATAFIFAFAFCVSFAEAASLSLSPTTGVYTVGQNFTARVAINTQGQPVNASEAVLKFDPAQLQVVNINQSGSIFNLWTIDPTFSNTAGTVTFGGGSPKGYTGSAGTILSITFRPKAAGTAKVTFTSGSALAADGKGTNVLTNMSGSTYTVAAVTAEPQPEEIVQYVAPANTPAAPSISSKTHPNQGDWYQSTKAELTWSLPSGVTAVRTGLDNNPGSVPSVVYDNPISSKTLEDLEPGVQYFHLQFKNENGWGKVAHYRLAVDNQKPTAFEITMADENITNPQPTLQFKVTDEGSGAVRYIIQLDGGEATEFIDDSGKGLYQLPKIQPGRHSVTVEAFDAADNSIVANFAFDIASFEKPVFTDYPAQIAADVIPVITGSTRPNATVVISVTAVGGEYANAVGAEYEVKANAEGVFTFIPDGRFTNGVYELVAVSTDEYGAQSDPSNTLRLVVADPTYVQAGTAAVKILSFLVPLIALLLLLVLVTVYLFGRIRRISRFVIRETKEAEESVVMSFAKLREVIETHAKTLAASRKTKKLTKAETDLFAALRNEVAAAERRVSKEVSDVDDVVSK